MSEDKTLKERFHEAVCDIADKAENAFDAGTGVGERFAKELREWVECDEEDEDDLDDDTMPKPPGVDDDIPRTRNPFPIKFDDTIINDEEELLQRFKDYSEQLVTKDEMTLEMFKSEKQKMKHLKQVARKYASGYYY